MATSQSYDMSRTKPFMDPDNFFVQHWETMEEYRTSTDTSFLRQAWINYDNDGSGSLELDEVEKLCLDYMIAIPEMSAKRTAQQNIAAWDKQVHKLALLSARRVFEMCDADNSGEIDYDEFCTAFYSIVGRSIELKTVNALKAGRLSNHHDNQNDRKQVEEANVSASFNRLLQSYKTDDIVEQTSPVLCEIMQKKDVDRTPKDIELVLTLLDRIGLWSKLNLPVDTRRYVARHLQYEAVPAEYTICEQNEPVSSIFVILSGSAFSISKDSSGVNHSISSLTPGSISGESEILKNIDSEKQVITREFTEIARLDIRIFNQVLRPHHSESLRKKLKFFRSIPALSSCNGNHLMELALHSRYLILPSNTIIQQQGDPTDLIDPLYFISEGEVRVVQEIAVKKPQQIVRSARRLEEDKGEIKRTTKKSIFVELARMGSRNMFGELELSKRARPGHSITRKHSASIISTTRTVVLKVNRALFAAAVNPSSMESAQKTHRQPSNVREYLQVLRFNTSWSNYKTRLRRQLQDRHKITGHIPIADVMPQFNKCLRRTKKQARTKRTEE